MSHNSLSEPINLDIEDQQSGLLYLFTPNVHLSRLRIACERKPNSPLKTLIWRKALVVVIDQSCGEWWLVQSNGYSGWLLVTEDALLSKALKPIQSFKRFEDWQGKNAFLCNGKFIAGSEPRFFW